MHKNREVREEKLKTQFAGAAVRILRSNLERAGIGGSLRSFFHAKHGILPFSLGKRSLLVLQFASCEAILSEPGSAEA
jgi:hypothetical protein